MQTEDIRYWDRFWAQDELGPQWKHFAAADLVAAEPVIDIGCGSGLFLEMLKKRGMGSLVGCDVSETGAVKTAERGFAALRCNAETSLPFSDSSFATASLVDVLEHSFEPERILQEACRVAREVVIVVPNFNSLVARLQVLAGRVPENNTPRKRHTTWFNRDVLARLLVSLDMEISAEHFHTLLYKRPPFSSFFRQLTHLRPELLALAFAIKVRARTG